MTWRCRWCLLAWKLTSIDTTDVGDDAEDNETDEQSHLETGEPELNLAIVLDAEKVCRDADNEEDGNVCSKLDNKVSNRSHSKILCGSVLTCDEDSSQNPIMRPMAVISVGTVKPVNRI